MPPTYYRGCWHVVSRGFLIRYRQISSISSRYHSSLTTELYNPKTFIVHAALLGQGFPHCRKLPTAASRRSMGRVSVPLWPVILSDRLPIVALVSLYLTNQLMGRGLISKRQHAGRGRLSSQVTMSVFGISSRFQLLFPSWRQIIHALLTRAPLYSGPKPLSRSTCMC